MFYVAALTGRSGTGKSLASDYLKDKKNIPVIDGDKVARDVVERGSPCLKDLVEEFSNSILNSDGSLNRRLLADICFSDERKKQRLDEISHPYIIAGILDLFDKLHSEHHRFCVVEAAALIESGLYANCDKIILISSDEQRQIERIMERDNITQAQAKTRINAQTSEEVVRAMCDEEIKNNGTVEEFFAQLDVLCEKFDKWFA
ncbi:MAG: dephospho-CoA kinase [Oscillospiraceae bacterium]